MRQAPGAAGKTCACGDPPLTDEGLRDSVATGSQTAMSFAEVSSLYPHLINRT